MFDMARSSAGASAQLDTAFKAPNPGLPELTPEVLFANRTAQPLIVAATMAMWEAIRPFAPRPDLLAGYSIGELSAYGIAGAFDAGIAVQLASRRAQLMDSCLTAHPGQSLLAISGLTPDRVAPLLQHASFHLSIETGDDTCIAGGPAAQLQQLEQAVAAAGGRSRKLPVEVASHTPYMAYAVAPFAEALRAAPFAPMDAPVLAGISGTAIDNKDQAVETLSRQLAEPIRWRACMDACAEAGITVALELGPGAALSRMLHARHPHIGCRSVADFRSLEGIRIWLERQMD
jgi:[acyl-carrier-protein] S-malonyltransferase